MVEQTRLAVLADPGLGKTRIALEAFQRLRSWVEVRSMLVVAPLRVCYSVWPAEANRWAPGLCVQILHGPTRRADCLSGADVYLINPEGLGWLADQHWDWPEMLIVDESTRFKRHSSGRSRRLAKVLKHFPRRYILTGTPAPNGLEDLHGQFYVLDEGRTLFPTVGEFRETWEMSVPTGSQGYTKWRVRKGCAPEIYARIAPMSVRLDAKDHLDLPALVPVTINIDLPEAARADYDKLRQDMVLDLREGGVVAMNAGALTAKCRQYANGVVYLTDDGLISAGKTRHSAVVHRAKVEALADLVEQLQGQPLLVAYEHTSELALIEHALQPLVGKVPHIGGGVSGPAGELIVRQWNAGLLPVLLVQPQSGALGLNLQDGGHHLAWFALPWDLEHYDQLIRRLLRQGQTAAHVLVYHLAVRDTVDGTVMRALARKDDEQRSLLDYLREDALGTLS